MLVCDVRHQKHLIFQLGLLSIPEPLGALLPAPAQGSTSSPMQCWQCYEFSRLSSLLPLLPSPHGNCPQFPGTSPRLGHGALAKCCLDILAVNVQETRGRPARKKKHSLKQTQGCSQCLPRPAWPHRQVLTQFQRPAFGSTQLQTWKHKLSFLRAGIMTYLCTEHNAWHRVGPPSIFMNNG